MTLDEWKLRYKEVSISLARQEYADQECDRLRAEAMEQLRRCDEYTNTFRYAADDYRKQLQELEQKMPDAGMVVRS